MPERRVTADHRLRILHLSDLHAGAPADGDRASLRARALGRGWAENLERITAERPVDLVVLTGDVAHAGRAADYAEATRFVEDLLARLSVPRDRFFVVPGNHDICRRVARVAYGEVYALDEEAVAPWMAGGAAPPGVDPRSRSGVLRRQGPYRHWIRSILGQPANVPRRGAAHPRLGYRRTLALRRLPFPVHVIGLDSAWLTGGDGTGHEVRLMRDQVLRLATRRGDPLDGFRCALIHHAIDALADVDRCREIMADHTDLVLRGALRASDIGGRLGDTRPLEIASGRLDGHPLLPCTVGVIDVALDRKGRLNGVDLWVRGALEAGTWGDYDGIYAGSTSGRLTRRFARDASAKAGPCAARDPWSEDRAAPVVALRVPNGVIELGALAAGLAQAIGVPWTGPETWVTLLVWLRRSRALVSLDNVATDSSVSAATKLARRLPGVPVMATGAALGLGQPPGGRRLGMGGIDDVAATAPG